MKKLSANPRARAGELYRMRSVHTPYVSAACEHAPTTEHINTHKPELYGLITQLTTESLSRSLELRDIRGPYGLTDVGSRPVRVLRDARTLNKAMKCTLRSDIKSTMEDNPELAEATDDYLAHLQPIDKALHGTTAALLSAGVTTALEVAENNYEIMRHEFELSSDEITDNWRLLFDQAALSLKQLIALPGRNHALEQRTGVFKADDQGIVTLCKDAINARAERVAYIEERDTVGCPITFEPALLREFWQWYVALRTELPTN